MTHNALVVPVRVDLLTVQERVEVEGRVVQEATVTAGPSVDFSRLPYHDGKRDVNPGRPYLGESVADTPFEEAAAWLPAGNHLHWALPEALTRGRHRPGGGEVAPSLDFPRVPDRWLVGAADGWSVVESDYLHPEGVDASASAISYLMPAEQRGRSPFRYLGRQVPLADWRPHDAGAQYLHGLTAVGWGHPAFHAYYPDCRSVFGFHDAAGVGGPYQVFGWYSRLADDPVAAYAAAHRSRSDSELVQGLHEEFGWHPVPEDEHPVARPTRLLCAGRWEPAGSQPVVRSVDHIVLGATGAEALAALLAGRPDPDQPDLADLLPEVPADLSALHEETLESILLSSRLDPDRPDAVAALLEARHDKEFVGVPGGTLWTVRARSRGLAADAAQAPSSAPGTAPADAAARLAELNRLQHERDVLDRQQDVLSSQLHSDWCKYQVCRYPPRGSRLDHPDVDGLRRHIEVTSLAALETNFVAYDRATGALAAHAAEVSDLLAAADVRDVDVRAEDVLDWAGLAAAPDASLVLGEELVFRLGIAPAEESLRALAVEVLGNAVRGDAVPAEVRREGVDPALLAWLYARGPDDAATVAIARMCRTLFPRPEHAEQARRFGALAAERSAAVTTAHRHRAILELVLPGVLRTAPKARHELDIRPGPRFWRPRDPVLLLAGSGMAVSGRHPRRGGPVYGAVVPMGPEPASWLVAALDDRGGSAVSPVASSIAVVARLAGDPDPDPWHPIMLDWKVALHEEPGADPDQLPGERYRYDPDHVVSRYRLRENRPDIAPRHPEATTGSHRATLVVGRATLSPHPTRELRKALEIRPEGTNGFVNAVARQAVTVMDGASVQVASLSGLDAALLMHEPVVPVGIDDPLAFPENKAFAARVANAIGRHTHDAPRPQLHFMPIRAGRLQVVGLRVVDSFGRLLDVPLDGPGRISSSTALPAGWLGTGTDRIDVFALPPRLVPPARLRMRWLAAGRPDTGGRPDESHDHPSTGPVCGWLVPNVLDERIMVHGADGEAIGSIDRPGRWRPAPGRDRIVPPEDIDDPGLRRVVVHLLHRSPDSRGLLLATLGTALDQIQPDSHAQHRSIALLMGRPIAVVRASVRLEVLGALPLDQGWAELRAVLGGAERSTAGLETVRFPLRLGEHGLLDDGLLGFWVESGADFGDGSFYAPQGLGDFPEPSGMTAGRTDNDPVVAGGGNVTLTVDGPTEYLTMLVDPRGSVHATTGILPAKVLRIPPEQYGPSLDRIGVTFLAAPVLTDPDQLRVALPAEPGHRWSWLERTPTGWAETPAAALGQLRADATLAGAQELREGWLKLAPVPGDEEVRG
jgi:hypothetical protein